MTGAYDVVGRALRARAEHLHRAAKAVFFLCFVLLTLHGLFSPPERKAARPAAVGEPIFSVTREVFSENDSLSGLGAQSAALLSAQTGELLYGHNSGALLPMASTTKIMTALVVLERCDPDAVFTVPKEVCGVEGSSVYLYPGEQITVRDLLYGLLLESGNDAAEALAVACSGSVEAFVAAMNEKAASLGLFATHFDNPHGLSSETHYTTAAELGRIACAAMQNTLFREIVSTVHYSVTSPDGTPSHYFVNHNKMLRRYDGAIGVKTGYTLASGRCLVTCAERDGDAYIAVTLNDRSDWNDHARLLDYAFSHYDCVKLADRNALTLPAAGGVFTNDDDLCLVFSRAQQEKRELDIKLYPA